MRLHPLHFGLPQASILRMRQQPKKQLYLFQFLLECFISWMYITSNVGNRGYWKKMNVECLASVEKQPNVLN